MTTVYVKNRKINIVVTIKNADGTARDISLATIKQLHFVSPRTGKLVTRAATFTVNAGVDGVLTVLMDPWFFTEEGEWTIIPELVMPDFEGCTEEAQVAVRRLPHQDIRRDIAA